MRAVKLGLTISLVSFISISAGVPIASAQMNWGNLPALTNVAARQTQMSDDLTAAVAQGRLTAAEANSFKAELNRIKGLETQMRTDGKLSMWERTRLIFELDNLQKQIDAGLAPRTSGLTDMPGRQADIAAEISDLLFSGRLTRQEGDALTAELNRIKAKEAQYKQDGALSNAEILQLSTDLDQLQKSVHARSSSVVSASPSIDSKKAEINTRITKLAARGRLTPAEVATLKQDLQRIEAKQAEFQASGGSIDTNESLTLAIELEKLSSSLDRYQPDAPGANTIAAARQRVEKSLSDAVLSGKLNSQQVLELKSEYDRIANLETSFRADGQLSDSETQTLSTDLTNLQTRVARLSGIGGPVAGGGPGNNNGGGIGGGPIGAPAIDNRIARLKKRIADSEADGKLSGVTAREMHRKIERIEDQRRFFEQDGELSNNESSQLVGDLDELKIAMDRAMSPLPNVTAMRGEIERKLRDAVAAARLSPQEAESVRTDLARIDNLEDTFRASEGGLSDQEIVALSREYNAVSTRVDRSTPSLPDINAKQNELRRKIADALASGKITAGANSDLQREFDRIRDAEANFRRSDNDLSLFESQTLVHDLDRLAEDLNRAMVSSQQPPVASGGDASAAPDTRGHWAEQYVALLSKRGTIGGFPDGTFKPDDQITRAQFAAIASRALNLPQSGRPADFKDVPAKYWANNVIAQASDAGLVTGFPDGTFRPEDKITRAQALVILAKALQNAGSDPAALSRYDDGGSVPAWARPSVVKAATAGIIVNHPNPQSIRPNDLATRAEIAALTYQTMSKLGEQLPQIRVGLEASGQ